MPAIRRWHRKRACRGAWRKSLTIAQRLRPEYDELAAYNGIANPNIVFVGQKIAIPGSGAAPQTLATATAELPGDDGYYTVVGGETLSQIAKHNGMTTADLMRLNGIRTPT